MINGHRLKNRSYVWHCRQCPPRTYQRARSNHPHQYLASCPRAQRNVVGTQAHESFHEICSANSCALGPVPSLHALLLDVMRRRALGKNLGSNLTSNPQFGREGARERERETEKGREMGRRRRAKGNNKEDETRKREVL